MAQLIAQLLKIKNGSLGTQTVAYPPIFSSDFNYEMDNEIMGYKFGDSGEKN